MRKTKTKYLAYIEETPKHFQKLESVAKKSTSLAIAKAKDNNLPITYLQDSWIVKEFPDGKKVRIHKVLSSPKKALVGEKFNLSKR